MNSDAEESISVESISAESVPDEIPLEQAPEVSVKALKLAVALSETVDEVARRLKKDKTLLRRLRHIVLALVISFVFDIGLTTWLTVNSVQTHNIQNAIRQANLSQCQANNTARDEDKLLWTSFFAALVPPGTKLSAKDAARLAQLRGLLNAKDAHRDCVTIYAAAK